MANKITPEDIALAEQLEEIVKKIQETNKIDLDQKIQLKNAEKTLKEMLEDKFAKQAKFLTSAEIEVELLEKRQAILKQQLAASERIQESQKEYNDLLTKISNREEERNENKQKLKEIEDELAFAQGERLAELQVEQKRIKTLQDTEKQRYDALIKSAGEQGAKLQEIQGTEQATTEELREQVKQGEILLRTGNKRKTVAQDVKSVTQNTLASTLGIRSASSTIADHLIDAALSSKNFKDVADGINTAFKETVTSANIIKGVMGGIGALARKAAGIVNPISTIKDMIFDIANTEAILTKATGFTNKFGQELEKLKLIKSDILLEELDRTFSSLLQTSLKFSTFNEKARKELVETAALFGRLGVDAKTFGENLDNLTYTFGLSQQQVRKMTGEMIGFNRALGIGTNEGLSEFNRQMNLIATHGLKRGTEIFKALQLNVKATSVAMSDLISIGKKFDTFDGAMEAAGKLNLILQGPYLNSMQMLNATEEKRIELIRDALKASGMQFEDLDRRQKEAFAGTIGVGEAVAQQLFQSGSLKTLEEAQKSVAGRLEDEKGLKDTSKDLLTAQEKLARTLQNTARSMTILGKGLKDAVDALKELNIEGTESLGWAAMFGDAMIGIAQVVGGGIVGGMFATRRAGGKAPKGGGGGAGGSAKGSGSSATTKVTTPKGTGTTTGVKLTTPKLAAPPATGYTPPPGVTTGGAAAESKVIAKVTTEAAETTTKASVSAAANITKSGTGFFAAIKESGKEFLKSIRNPKNIARALGGAAKGGILGYLSELIGTEIGDTFNEKFRTKSAGRFGEQGTGIMREFERPGYDTSVGGFIDFLTSGDQIYDEGDVDGISVTDTVLRSLSKLNPFSASGKAKGRGLGNFGNSFVGEMGAEFIFDPQNRNFSLAGLLGAELRKISQSAEIFPAQQTAGMLETMENFSGAVADFFTFSNAAANQPMQATVAGNAQPVNLHVNLEVDGQRFATLVETITADTLNRAFRG